MTLRLRRFSRLSKTCDEFRGNTDYGHAYARPKHRQNGAKEHLRVNTGKAHGTDIGMDTEFW